MVCDETDCDNNNVLCRPTFSGVTTFGVFIFLGLGVAVGVLAERVLFLLER